MTASSRLPITDAATIGTSQVELTADVVIVGSGAGGAVAAYELAAAGRSVVVLEAGPYVPSSEFTERGGEMFDRLYADHGGQTNTTGDLVVLQGRCVGGSTVVNAAACFRTPDRILADWRTAHGLTDLTPERLRPYFERVEKRLSVHVNQAHEINQNSRLLEAGCEKLGLSSKPLSRNVKDCALTGFCISGCASDRKQSMLVTYVPWSLQKGARLFADTTVERILIESGRAVGVEAETRDPNTGRKVADVRVRAKAVVLAAGAVQTPILLLKNQLANASGMVGKNFACHPSLGMLAEFDHDLFGYRGATLGSYCDEYEEPAKGGFILEGGTVGPDVLAAMAPGFGRQALAFMKSFNRVAAMVSLIHDDNSGAVEWSAEKGKQIRYALSEKDKATIRRCMLAAGRIFFAAGAKRFILPTYAPTIVEHEAELQGAIDALTLDPHTVKVTSYHPQGTCRMGADRQHSVVSPSGQTHDVPGLYVADASLFPTSIMVNPQISVYALATYIAEKIQAALG